MPSLQDCKDSKPHGRRQLCLYVCTLADTKKRGFRTSDLTVVQGDGERELGATLLELQNDLFDIDL